MFSGKRCGFSFLDRQAPQEKKQIKSMDLAVLFFADISRPTANPSSLFVKVSSRLAKNSLLVLFFSTTSSTDNPLSLSLYPSNFLFYKTASS
jgi:hypothetical protein